MGIRFRRHPQGVAPSPKGRNTRPSTSRSDQFDRSRADVAPFCRTRARKACRSDQMSTQLSLSSAAAQRKPGELDHPAERPTCR
jgi:hypothetical protein